MSNKATFLKARFRDGLFVGVPLSRQLIWPREIFQTCQGGEAQKFLSANVAPCPQMFPNVSQIYAHTTVRGGAPKTRCIIMAPARPVPSGAMLEKVKIMNAEITEQVRPIFREQIMMQTVLGNAVLTKLPAGTILKLADTKFFSQSPCPNPALGPPMSCLAKFL